MSTKWQNFSPHSGCRVIWILVTVLQDFKWEWKVREQTLKIFRLIPSSPLKYTRLSSPRPANDVLRFLSATGSVSFRMSLEMGPLTSGVLGTRWPLFGCIMLGLTAVGPQSSWSNCCPFSGDPALQVPGEPINWHNLPSRLAPWQSCLGKQVWLVSRIWTCLGFLCRKNYCRHSLCCCLFVLILLLTSILYYIGVYFFLDYICFRFLCFIFF